MRDFSHWCAQVLRCVHFSPDRKAIEQELSAHYEDSVRDYERVGYEAALARERALRDLGDPEEVGRSLNRAHAPWLGWLWLVSRAGFWLSFWAGVYVVAVHGFLTGSLDAVTCLRNTVFPPEGDLGLYETVKAEREASPDYTWGGPLTTEGSFDTGDYAITLVKGDWWHNEKRDLYEARAIWKVTPKELWYSEPGGWVTWRVYDFLELTTDAGQSLHCFQQKGDFYHQEVPQVEWYEEVFELTGAHWMDPEREGEPIAYGRDLGGWYLSLELTTREQPEWMELTYPIGENGWAWRIDWEVAE